MNIIIGLVGFIVGAAVGAYAMYLVARNAIYVVKTQETEKHQELLNETADHAGIWQDCVNDILDAIEMGKLQNRSIPDQMSLVRKIVLSDTVERKPEHPEDVTEYINPDE